MDGEQEVRECQLKYEDILDVSRSICIYPHLSVCLVTFLVPLVSELLVLSHKHRERERERERYGQKYTSYSE